MYFMVDELSRLLLDWDFSGTRWWFGGGGERGGGEAGEQPIDK